MNPANKKNYDETAYPYAENQESLDSTHAVSGRHASKEDLDVLKAYFREMGEVPQMTAAQEAEAWQKIDQCLQTTRNVMYKFGFIFKEHIRILADPEIDELSDIFPVDPTNPLQNFTLDNAKRKEWLDEISLIHEKIILQFSKRKSSKKLNDLREEGINVLMKHPALPVQLLEWHDVALRYQQLYREGSLSESDLEEKTLCTVDEFIENLEVATQLREEFELWKVKMLETNLRLVINIAKHYQNRGLPFGDLIQEGNLGLMKALDKFNYKLGHRFCTYASWWIKQGVARALSGQSRTIRLPLHMITTIRKMHSAEQNFIQVNGRDPQDEDVAQILGLSVEKVRAIRKMSLQCISLQAPSSGKEDSATFEDILMDQQAEDPMKVYAKKILKQRLNDALAQLSERQRQIISMRYGLDGSPAKSLSEVSEAFHVTRERVRQIELKTLDKLRKHADPQTYLDDFFL
ncbi:MAG: sigma-70 family RNA polymerase sigma factor [Lentisphaerae bacterium]|nr:sigma-70 family RNA polymerase sigma factor [Lentisphaerota bacterium]